MYNVPFNTRSKRKDISKEGLIDPIVFSRFDICPFCKAQKVELLSFNNIKQSYSKAVDLYFQGYNIGFDKYEIHSMKCLSCGHEFIIDWSIGFPKPLISNMFTDIFLSEFVHGI